MLKTGTIGRSRRSFDRTRCGSYYCAEFCLTNRPASFFSSVVKLKFDPTCDLSLTDPREVPTYSIAEAAHILRLPCATLRSWVVGRHYPTDKGRKKFEPVIDIADKSHSLLSFVNLAEAHVLSACRRVHTIPLEKIRAAVAYLKSQFHSKHPLVESEFETNGISLFTTHLGQLIDTSAQGQIVIRDFVVEHLKRLERENNLVTRLYPFTREDIADSPKSVFIDPRVSFGRLILATARIPTIAIAERYWAGESIDHLADDYGCGRLDVEEAIRCERPRQAA